MAALELGKSVTWLRTYSVMRAISYNFLLTRYCIQACSRNSCALCCSVSRRVAVTMTVSCQHFQTVVQLIVNIFPWGKIC